MASCSRRQQHIAAARMCLWFCVLHGKFAVEKNIGDQSGCGAYKVVGVVLSLQEND
jgi:hypothetical protein